MSLSRYWALPSVPRPMISDHVGRAWRQDDEHCPWPRGGGNVDTREPDLLPWSVRADALDCRYSCLALDPPVNPTYSTNPQVADTPEGRYCCWCCSGPPPHCWQGYSIPGIFRSTQDVGLNSESCPPNSLTLTLGSSSVGKSPLKQCIISLLK